ncbi:hypothetical protein NDU88_004825 [Pleurodeles waltl]|uniref:Uncharacterized protein n=1 Tax=Pleurodeles waltl TaxID=8319 RepID=A0AAV7LS56_PLEWA|nr:hypothetical protein NDU88_004825 [Pleurodeles waltl]
MGHRLSRGPPPGRSPLGGLTAPHKRNSASLRPPPTRTSGPRIHVGSARFHSAPLWGSRHRAPPLSEPHRCPAP